MELTKGETSEWDVNDVRRPGARKLPWSEDGSKWVLAIKQKDSWYILDNGKKIAVTGDFVDFPVLSPDGKILLYSTKLGSYVTIYKNYKTLAKWNYLCELNAGTHFFPSNEPPLLMTSPKGNRIAYCAGNANKEVFLVVDGVKYGPYTEIDIFLFSKAGKRWAAIGQRGERGEKGTQERIIVDGVSGDWLPWASIRDISFDSSENHIVYTLKREGTRKILLDHKPLLGCSNDDIEKVFFEPSGKLCILSRKKGGGYRIWLEGKHGELWDSIEGFTLKSFEILGYMNYVGHRKGDVYLVTRKISQ